MKKDQLINQFKKFIEILENNEISEQDLELLEDHNYQATLIVPILIEWNNKEKYPKFNTSIGKQSVKASIEDDIELYVRKNFFYKSRLMCVYFGLGSRNENYELSIYVEEENQNCFDDETMKLVNQLTDTGFGGYDRQEDMYLVEFSLNSADTFKKVCDITARLEELL